MIRVILMIVYFATAAVSASAGVLNVPRENLHVNEALADIVVELDDSDFDSVSNNDGFTGFELFAKCHSDNTDSCFILEPCIVSRVTCERSPFMVLRVELYQGGLSLLRPV